MLLLLLLLNNFRYQNFLPHVLNSMVIIESKQIRGQWAVQSCMLRFKPLNVRRIAENILTAVRVALKRDAIEDKVFYIDSEFGSNVVKAH